MKKFKKLMAGVLAMTVVGTGASMFSASAYGIPDAPGSSFTYDLNARIISPTEIEVDFVVTNNPGMTNFSLLLQYDEDCTFEKRVNLYQDLYIGVYADNAAEHHVFEGFSGLPDAISGNAEKTDLFTVQYYFTVDNAYAKAYDFSSAIASYKSTTENISFDHAKTGATYESPVYAGIDYTLGDMDDDGEIEISDSSDVLAVIGMNGNRAMTVDALNAKILTPSSNAWKTRFPNLPCAETADVDFDGTITQDDATGILQYYSNEAASLPTDTLIGTSRVKTITVSA